MELTNLISQVELFPAGFPVEIDLELLKSDRLYSSEALKKIMFHFNKNPVLFKDPFILNHLLGFHRTMEDPAIFSKSLKWKKKIEHFKIWVVRKALLAHKYSWEELEKIIEDPVDKHWMQPIAQKELAVTKIQAVIRRWNTENSIVFPSQVSNLFNDMRNYEIDSAKDMAEVTRFFCQQINKISLNPHYKGKSISLSSLTRKDAYPSPCKGWVEVNEKGDKVYLISTKYLTSDEGGYKKVYPAHCFGISLSIEKGQRWSISLPSIIFKPKYKEDHEFILKSIESHCDLFELSEKTPSLNIAPYPIMRRPNIRGQERYLFLQDWFNTDLFQASHKGEIPFTFKANSLLHRLTFTDKLNILIDISKTLDEMHFHGIIHGDVKGDNILIKMEGSPAGYLNDFDYTKPIGYTSDNREYFFWDTSRKNGWITPACDVYGFILALGHALVPPVYENKVRFRNWIETFEHFSPSKENLFIQEYLKHRLSFCDPAVKSLVEAMDEMSFPWLTFTSVLALHKDLPAQARDDLQQLVPEISAVKSLYALISSILQKERSFYDFILHNRSIQNLLKSKDIEGKKRLIKIFSSEFPTMKTVGNRLKKILSQFQEERDRFKIFCDWNT